MKKSFVSFLASFVVVSSFAGGAFAAPSEASPTELSTAHDHWAGAGMNVGMEFGSTPGGPAEMFVEWAPIRPLVLHGGVGVSFSGNATYEAMLRYRLVTNDAHGWTPYVGLGFAAGRRTPEADVHTICGDECNETAAVWNVAWWTNAELGIEWRTTGGSARLYGGYAFLLNPNSATCPAGSADCAKGEGGELLFGGAIGFAF